MTLAISGTTGLTLAGQFDSASTFAFKNRFINGAMVIDQRNAGASVPVTASAPFTVDRWQSYGSQSGKLNVQQTPSATETGYATRVGAGFTSYLACTSQSAYTVGTSEYFNILQSIEGLNISDFAWGTANAKTITISFWAYSSLTGTFGGAINNNGNSRSYPFSYTISAANTWEQKTITIAGDTSGTWLITNGVGMYVRFCLGAGATVSGTAGAWSGSTFISATGATSVVGTSGATFYITGVQLEKSSIATTFDYRPYGTELALCQRYYESGSSFLTVAPTGISPVFSQVYLVEKRSTGPTITVTANTSITGSAAGTTYYASGVSQANPDAKKFVLNNTAAQAIGATWTSSAEL